ncbi:MAG: 50S ribosomal protein L10 [Clostridia bacterium]|nr:50S ribosomal protein L10 [Clostridia bacterium]
MPSAKVLESKQAVVAALTERLKNACAGIIVDYKGITVADDTALRKELREAGVEYTVVKNTLLRLAIAATELNGLETVLDGTTAIATSADDYVAAARILSKFADTHKEFNIKNGFLDTEVIDTAKIAGLAKLPSREVLLAQVLGAFQAPIAAFARAIQAIVDNGGEPTADAAAEAAEPEAAEAAEPVAEAAEPEAAPAAAEAPAAEEAAAE